ncbi:unnamed protein product [Penicillium nalgiovense]|nr:unnamed protein product [Penicillium nalgiovense]
MRSLVRASLNARLGANITRTQPGINPAYRIPWGALPTTTFQSRPSSTLDPVSTKEKPPSFPIEGYPIIKADQPAEEELLFDYSAYRYYPVHIGKIFQDRYQVCSKLGWGSCSTTWLARDLKFVYIHDSVFHRKLLFYKYITLYISSDHLGRENIRRFYDSFTVTGLDSGHIVLV